MNECLKYVNSSKKDWEEIIINALQNINNGDNDFGSITAKHCKKKYYYEEY